MYVCLQQLFGRFFWDIHPCNANRFSICICITKSHQCLINTFNVCSILPMSGPWDISPDINSRPIGHLRWVYNVSIMEHNSLSDARGRFWSHNPSRFQILQLTSCSFLQLLSPSQRQTSCSWRAYALLTRKTSNSHCKWSAARLLPFRGTTLPYAHTATVVAHPLELLSTSTSERLLCFIPDINVR